MLGKHSTKLFPVGIQAALLVFVLVQTAVAAGDKDKAILRLVSGNQSFDLDRAALEALPQVRFETETIWTDEKKAFSGPTLMSVLDLAGIDNESVVATAANAYEATIPAELIEKASPIIATRINGETFSLREKGPLWIVFPFDRGSRYQREVVFASSVWQLIQVRPVGD